MKKGDTKANNDDMICDFYGDKTIENTQFLKLIPLFTDEKDGDDKENRFFEEIKTVLDNMTSILENG